MAVSNQYVARAVECLARVAPISYRRIFHGVGIYHQGTQFAFIVNDRLYFRADEASRSLYEDRSMTPFCPGSIGSAESNFYQLPEEVLDTPAELLYWMRTAVEAARNSHAAEQDESFVDVKIRHLHVR